MANVRSGTARSLQPSSTPAQTKKPSLTKPAQPAVTTPARSWTGADKAAVTKTPLPALSPAVAAWNKSGLTIAPETLGETATARLSKAMSPRALAAAAFGIPEAQVSARHWRLLTVANPSLAAVNFDSGALAAGQIVQLSATVPALEARQASLQAGLKNGNALLDQAKKAKAGSKDRLNDTELLTLTSAMEGLKNELTQVQHSLSTRPLEDQLGRSETAAMAAAAKGDTAGALKAFAPYEAQLAKLTAPEDAAVRTTMERELAISKANTHVSVAQASATKGNAASAAASLKAAYATFDGLLAQKDLPLDARTAIHSRKATLQVSEAQLYLNNPQLMNGLLSGKPDAKVRDQRVAKVLAESTKAYAGATAELKGVQDELQAAIAKAGPSTPEGQALAKQLEAATTWKNSLAHEQLGIAADIKGAAGDTEGQLTGLRDSLASSMGTTPAKLQAMLEPDEHKRINSQAEEKPWYRVDQLFSSHKVGFLSKAKLDTLAAAVQKLPVARRDEALESLCRYADASSAAGDLSRMNVNRQTLHALSDRLQLAPLKVQSTIADAEYVGATGDLADSAKGFAEATALAKALPDSEVKPALEARALFGHANALQQLATNGEYKQKGPAAAALRELRVNAEKTGHPFGREQLSRLNMMEMSAYLGADQSQDAQQTLEHLKSAYVKAGDVPWLNAAVKDFEKKNTDWKPAAFMQVAMSEANSESMGEAMGYGLGGAAAGAGVGAAVGVWFFGVGAIPGAALGAMIGGAAGTLGLKTRNIVRGWDKIGDAGRTGLNSQTALTTVMDTVSLGLDVVSIVAPVKGLGSIGKVGFKALATTGAEVASTAGEKLLADLSSQAEKSVVANLGKEAAEKMGKKEFDRLGKEVLLRQIANETLDFGGKKVVVASLGLAATPFATELWRIQTSDMSATEKSAARQKLASNLGQAALNMGVMLVSSSVINKFATNPVGATKELRQALSDISVKGQAVMVNGTQVNTVTPQKGTVRDLLKEGFLDNVINSPEWLAKRLAHGTGMNDLKLLQKEAPEAVKKVMGQVSDRFNISEENTFAFGNSSGAFSAQLDSKEFFGVCAGLTLTRRRINMLAFFDDGKAAKLEACPFDAKTHPKEYTNFYKERLTSMVKDQKAAYVPGFKNLNELSKDPLIAPVLKDLVLREWGVNNATPYKGIYKMLGGVTKKGYSFAEATELMKQINDSHKVGPNPVMWLSSHNESMFSTKQWIHVMEAVSATQDVPGGPITITGWDPNSTSGSGMKATITVSPDGKAMYGSRELNEVEILPGDKMEVSTAVANRVKFAGKHPELVNTPLPIAHVDLQ